MTATDLDFQRGDLLVPPGTLKAWQGPDAIAFRSCIAAEFNNLAITAELVGDARNPLKCDASVLPYHGADRRIRQYSTESERSYRLRLAKWRQIWASAGRAWGILRQLRIFLSPFGRPLLRYVSTSGSGLVSQWFDLAPGDGTRDYFELGGLDPEFTRTIADPSNWNWDGDFARWSRYWVLIYTDGLTGVSPPEEWDGAIAEWDGTDRWDGYFSSEQIADMVSLCRDWGAPQSQIAGLFQVHDPTAFNPSALPVAYPDGTTSHPDGTWYLRERRRAGVTYSFVKGPE